MSEPSPLRPGRLSLHLAMASLVSIAAVAAVCGLGLLSMGQFSAMTQRAIGGQIALLNDAAAFETLLYQKGFVAEYLLTRDRKNLARLEDSRRAFAAWFARARDEAQEGEAQAVLRSIADEYAAYEAARTTAVARADAGEAEAARGLLKENQVRAEQLLHLCQAFGQLGRRQAERDLRLAQRTMRQRTLVLLLLSIAGTLASVAVGFFLARKIARPIYELTLQVESAVQRTRLTAPRGSAGLAALGDHVGALLRKLEETDAAIIEQRQRLLQSEKLSAIGELSAKLAHEILNPLAGMKAAVQLLCRDDARSSRPEQVRDTALALDREITRIEQLLRHLVRYARPLSPRTEVCALPRLLDDAVAAALPALQRAGVTLVRHEEPGIPPLEVDRLLMTQVLCNLLTNAAQASHASGGGGRVEVSAARVAHLGRDHVCLQVTDQGPGIPEEALPRLFHPFFTTKPDGNGLGLAISQNIVLEHGGQIAGANRPGGGAEFTVLVPILR